MPRTGDLQSASGYLNCYVCNRTFPSFNFRAELNVDGRVRCPECSSEFVEIINQGGQASTSRAAAGGGNSSAQSAARNDPQGDAGAGGSRGDGAARAPRVEVHAMFHSDSGDAPAMPMSVVDAISRFAPLSLPNGQQAFVLQVQDGALMSPFTMGVPFSDAIARNPEDWVVGDDLDAVVSRVLDAYMPPRRATAIEVLNSLPRLRVRGGPLSPRPTATLEAAARAATSTRFDSSQLHGPSVASVDAVASSGGFGGGGDSEEKDDESARAGRASTSMGRDAGAAEDTAVATESSEGLAGRLDSLAPSTAMAVPSASSAPTVPAVPAAAKATEVNAEDATDSRGDGFASCQPGELCTVCHDAFTHGVEVVELPCRHCFHEDCIMPWLRQQNTCPVCRMRLLVGNSGLNVNSNSRSAHWRERRSRAGRDNGGGGDDDWQDLSDWSRSLTQQSSPQPRQLASGAVASAGFRPQPMVLPPISPPQQQWRREAAGPAAGFPLLATLHPQPATDVLSLEERRAAEEALAPLRTRFASIRLLNAPVFPSAGAAAVRGAVGNVAMRPPWWPGAMAAVPTRGPQQGPTRTTDGSILHEHRRQQQQQGHNGDDGLPNNPNSNFPGTNGMVRPGPRPASGGPWAGGAGASGGTRSALRGGFLTSASGGGGAGRTLSESRQRTQQQPPPSSSATVAVGSGSGMGSNQARLAARALGPSLVSSLMSFAPPQSAAQTEATAEADSQLRSSGGPGAPSTAPCMSDRISELLDEVEEVLLRPDQAGRPQPSETEDPAGDVPHDFSASYRAEVRRMFGPLLGSQAAAAAAAVESRNSFPIPETATEVGQRTSSSGLASQRSRATMENGERGGGPEPTEETPCRQVARHTRLQDAASQAHLRQTSSSSNAGGDVDGNSTAEWSHNSASTSNMAVRGVGEGSGTSGHSNARLDHAAIEAKMRKISAQAALATSRRGRLAATARRMVATHAAPPAYVLAARSSGPPRRSGTVNQDGGSGSAAPVGASDDSGEAAPAAAVTNISASHPHSPAHRHCPDGGAGRGGFNPFGAVIGGAGAGLRFLGGVAGNLLLRRGPSGGSRVNTPDISQGSNGNSGSAGNSVREQKE
ncbi:hypothetical protein Vafri_14144 [Volvox africanus]|uniref:RING-type domain-containing protein n=1 Tax=Volvox africanus TaxID=51714 RepID=A0A8J4BF57_9CHLO|nr:hypothetical protein Vafri_14144 [Volvox africanus]